MQNPIPQPPTLANSIIADAGIGLPLAKAEVGYPEVVNSEDAEFVAWYTRVNGFAPTRGDSRVEDFFACWQAAELASPETLKRIEQAIEACKETANQHSQEILALTSAVQKLESVLGVISNKLSKYNPS
jgi:predicted RNase H-like HicB family nuclease